MNTKIEREVQFLKIYAIISTLAATIFLFSGFIGSDNIEKFEVIDVERINIVEKDGSLKMVISNQERQHPGIVNGKIIERKYPRPPGIIFFNHLGDEMGGLIYGENGGDGHFGSLTWDKVRNDQTIGFRYLEGDNGAYQSGLEMWQQPDIPSDVVNAKYDSIMEIKDETKRKAALQKMKDNNELSTYRLFLGKRRDNSTMLLLNDIKGNPRIVMLVSLDGTPKLEFRDESGNSIMSLPE